MSNPNVALYEELKTEFASKPTRFSITEDLDDLRGALNRLWLDERLVMERYHNYNKLPTFLFEVKGEETWIFIDVLYDTVKVVIRSNHSFDSMTSALALVTGLCETDETWGTLSELTEDIFTKVDDDDEDDF